MMKENRPPNIIYILTIVYIARKHTHVWRYAFSLYISAPPNLRTCSKWKKSNDDNEKKNSDSDMNFVYSLKRLDISIETQEKLQHEVNGKAYLRFVPYACSNRFSSVEPSSMMRTSKRPRPWSKWAVPAPFSGRAFK